jgi:hypothetical protein
MSFKQKSNEYPKIVEMLQQRIMEQRASRLTLL